MTDRIVNQFLCYLDGVEGRDGVFVMAASSRPDLVDVALLRPGRIDKSVFCTFPEQLDRIEILRIYTRRFDIAVNDSDISEMATMTTGFTSADLRGLCQNT